MPHDPDEFEQIAISRDLARRPEIKVLAQTLQRINTSGPVDITRPVTDDIPPIYITMAYRLLQDKNKRDALIMILGILT